MKVLITAGGTIEKIDEVRQISNTSTGALGVKLAESFLSYGACIEKIFYIGGSGALPPPPSEKIELTRIVNVADLKAALERILSLHKIDAVVHAMAVSDFTKKNITTFECVADALSERLYGNTDLTKEAIRDSFAQCLYQETDLDNGGKISSDVEHLIITMQRTPKIISFIRSSLPDAILVGFKLLNNVDLEVLINVASELLKKNNCDFVLANDKKDITPENHLGYLISKDGSYRKLSGKSNIASAIAAAVLEKASEGK